jgi:hypothetical protein
MAYLGAPPAPKATELDANTVETEDIQNGAVTAEKLAEGAAASTGKAIAMAIVFGG